MEKKDGFYKELDRSKDKKGLCGCVSMVIIFVLILALAETVLIVASKKWHYNPKQDLSFSLPFVSEGGLSSNELSDGAVTVTIGQGQLCKMISSGVSKNDLACAINQDGVKITGKLSSFLPANTSLLIVPKAQSQKIALELESVEVGSLKISPSLFRLFTGKIENLINSSDAIKNVNVSKVDLQEGMMVVEGSRK